MSEVPGIINSKIIDSKWDAFWSDEPGLLKDLSPRPTLVISTPFEAGSKQETQLTKMLEACKLSPDDYHILQFKEDTMLAWHLMREQLKLKQIILLGVPAEQLGVSVYFMPHQVSRFGDASWIVTGTLDELMSNAEVKTHVWNYGLKPVFLDKIYG